MTDSQGLRVLCTLPEITRGAGEKTGDQSREQKIKAYGPEKVERKKKLG